MTDQTPGHEMMDQTAGHESATHETAGHHRHIHWNLQFIHSQDNDKS